LSGPHVDGATHAWFWQVSPSAVQFWHAAPARPHAASMVPVTHELPEQQPWQLVGPHGALPTHALPEHVSPAGTQSWHAAPPKPHAVDELPVTHVSPWQHPEHVVGLQLG
jgi:hypothetical protein